MKTVLPKKVSEKFNEVKLENEEVIAYTSGLWNYDEGRYHVILTKDRIIILRFLLFETEILEHKIPDDLDHVDFKEGLIFDQLNINIRGIHNITLSFWAKRRRQSLAFFKKLSFKKMEAPEQEFVDEEK